MDAGSFSDCLKGADHEARLALLCQNLGVEHYESNPRSATLVNFVYHCLVHASAELALPDSKVNAYGRICADTFEAAAGSCASKSDAYAVFRAAMLDQASEEAGTAQFTLDEVRGLSKFVTHSLFRNFNLYEAALAAQPGERQTVRAVAIDTPMATRPLAQGALRSEIVFLDRSAEAAEGEASAGDAEGGGASEDASGDAA